MSALVERWHELLSDHHRPHRPLHRALRAIPLELPLSCHPPELLTRERGPAYWMKLPVDAQARMRQSLTGGENEGLGRPSAPKPEQMRTVAGRDRSRVCQGRVEMSIGGKGIELIIKINGKDAH